MAMPNILFDYLLPLIILVVIITTLLLPAIFFSILFYILIGKKVKKIRKWIFTSIIFVIFAVLSFIFLKFIRNIFN
jgi:hypothetical protein